VLLTRSPLSYPLLDNRVRLACVRHAASVDSEPGSNSHVKCAVHRLRALRRSDGSQLLTRSPVDLALALFSYFVFGEWSIRLATNSHPLTLDGRPPSRLATRRQTGPTRRPSSYSLSGPALERSVRPLSLCLHALSSFQRTGYSGQALPEQLTLFLLPGAPTDRAFPSVLGEPSEVTIQNPLCQAPCSSNDGFGSG
jgi:hypothetical protein